MIDRKDPREMVLCYLIKAHPLKVGENEIIKELSRMEGTSREETLLVLGSLHKDGLVDHDTAQPPNSSEVDTGYSLSVKGYEFVQSNGLDPRQECLSPREIESQLISTYDRMKGEMEIIRRNLEKNQRTLEEEMSGIRKSMVDHDQFLRTYMVRIVESISMFIGIFAIVVVMMVNILKDMVTIEEKEMFLIFVISVPALLIVTIIPGLWLVRSMILDTKVKA